MIKIRLIGKFIVWMLQGLCSRLFGKKSWLGGYFTLCKETFTRPGPEIMLIVVVLPIVSAFIIGIISGATFATEREALAIAGKAFYATCIWNIAALISMLWDKFIAEYERSFTILKGK
jgi:hypothetical protein